MAKNIVILSDGTGNSAAKAHKTNVWRLYTALEKREPDRQVVMYDDGVGSQQDTRMAAIAGAVGFGLRRNIIELYCFLCRNYEPGDRIYLFGFSRGAFTVRLLAALALKRGLLKVRSMISDKDLTALAEHEYKQYRKGYDRALLSCIYKKLLYGADDHDVAKHEDDPHIRFLGVWDTVDAYGLPNDELAILWDRLIFQMRFNDQNLNPKVRRAAQALSIDDERLTFHPLLWNEDRVTPEFDPTTSPSDIRQVWFAGVHADVGGGYAEPELALVSLEWMIAQAQAPYPDAPDHEGLILIDHEVARFSEQSTPHGKTHNSRKGLKALYRYRPRYVDYLSEDDSAEVTVRRPKIHASVFERVFRDVTPYAPLALPKDYEIVTTDETTPAPFETDKSRQDRWTRQERARDSVFWGRGVYNAFVLALVLLAAAPLLHSEREAGDGGMLAPMIDSADAMLPERADYWLDAFRADPVYLGVMIVLFAALFWLRKISADRTRRLANEAWIGDGPAPSPDEANGFTRTIRRLLPEQAGRIIYMALNVAFIAGLLIYAF